MKDKIARVIDILKSGGISELTEKINRNYMGIAPRKGKAIGRTCLNPFYYVNISNGGAVYFCCPDWVKYRIGVLSEKNTLKKLWNNRIARTFRKAMLSTELNRVCNAKACPHIGGGRLPLWNNDSKELTENNFKGFPGDIVSDEEVVKAVTEGKDYLDYMPRSIEIAADQRCNLKCKSCRPGPIHHVSKKEQKMLDLIQENIEAAAPTLRHLHMLGSGEVFFSPFCQEIIRKLNKKKYPLLNVDIITNGLLLTEKKWNSLGEGTGLIKHLGISIDAATKETYEELRYGGNWERLEKNLQFVSELRKSNALANTEINFVIQEKNFREIPAFIQMGKDLGIDNIVFLFIQKWDNVMDTSDYLKKAVHLPSHPLYKDFKKIMDDPICRSKGVRMPV